MLELIVELELKLYIELENELAAFTRTKVLTSKVDISKATNTIDVALLVVRRHLESLKTTPKSTFALRILRPFLVS